MKIILKSGSTEQILCDGHTNAQNKHVGPSGLRISGNVTPEEQRFLRATTGKPQNRGNLIIRISFGVVRECASFLAAEKFCATYQRDVLRGGSLYLLAENATGGFEKLVLADAVLVEVLTLHTGVTVDLNYTLIGGTLT